MANPSFNGIWDALYAPGEAAVMATKSDLLRQLQVAALNNQ